MLNGRAGCQGKGEPLATNHWPTLADRGTGSFRARRTHCQCHKVRLLWERRPSGKSCAPYLSVPEGGATQWFVFPPSSRGHLSALVGAISWYLGNAVPRFPAPAIKGNCTRVENRADVPWKAGNVYPLCSSFFIPLGERVVTWIAVCQTSCPL